jgi:NAD(P)-dependent dehydrogenase (short-subunit alcohol dehydrogenase family)
MTQTAIILGISSDIGLGLAQRLKRDGWNIIGIGRTPVEDVNFHYCNYSAGSINTVVSTLRQDGVKWDLFLSAIGTTEPIGKFFDLNFDDWEQSLYFNFAAQIRALHALWPLRAEKANVMFFAGGGTNGPFRNYSAYCVSKIALIKMCELLHDEASGSKENFFIIGPGYVRTKIHQETLKAGPAAGDNLENTLAKLEGPGTSIDDIYDHLLWCLHEGRDVIGGRNTATIHDPWRDDALAERLFGDPDLYRLRRQT